MFSSIPKLPAFSWLSVACHFESVIGSGEASDADIQKSIFCSSIPRFQLRPTRWKTYLIVFEISWTIIPSQIQINIIGTRCRSSNSLTLVYFHLPYYHDTLLQISRGVNWRHVHKLGFWAATCRVGIILSGWTKSSKVSKRELFFGTTWADYLKGPFLFSIAATFSTDDF